MNDSVMNGAASPQPSLVLAALLNTCRAYVSWLDANRQGIR